MNSFITKPLTEQGKKTRKTDHTLKEANAFVMDILRFIAAEKGTVIEDYFFGCTNDLYKRLFYCHNIKRNHDKYIAFEASSQQVVNEVMPQLREMGMNGCSKLAQGQHVYCYKIGSQTIERCE